VTAFGSVPLRTYLPDGDIDVCLLGRAVTPPCQIGYVDIPYRLSSTDVFDHTPY
jgi:hypothetical protein